MVTMGLDENWRLKPEWRSTRHNRRNGERGRDMVFFLLLLVVIIACFLYGAFHAGRYYEADVAKKAWIGKVAEAENELVKFKIRHYGATYFYFHDKKGNLCYVKNVDDLENQSKWRFAK